MSALTADCRHPRRKHTVWYWLEDGDPVPVPLSATFDNLRDALQFAQSGIDQNNPLLRWIKVFRADNEAYTCARWSNPEPLPEPPAPVIEKAAEPVTSRRRWWRR